jgi:hypothetical protein
MPYRRDATDRAAAARNAGLAWCEGWITDPPRHGRKSRPRRCGVRLDPVLTAAGYTTHPCCDPAEEESAAAGPVGDPATLPRYDAAPRHLAAVPAPPRETRAARQQPPDLAEAPSHPGEATATRSRRATTPCPGCGHAAHRDQCGRKWSSGCAPLLDPATGQPTGMACFAGRAPCPCPYGWCHHCQAPIVGASTLPLNAGSPEIDIERGSAGDPAGEWAVWKLADETLACRPLAPGEQPRAGEWRGREHTPARCPQRKEKTG